MPVDDRIRESVVRIGAAVDGDPAPALERVRARGKSRLARARVQWTALSMVTLIVAGVAASSIVRTASAPFEQRRARLPGVVPSCGTLQLRTPVASSAVTGSGRFIALMVERFDAGRPSAEILVCETGRGVVDRIAVPMSNDQWVQELVNRRLPESEDRPTPRDSRDALSISEDGRLLAFSAWADGVVARDRDGRSDVFVYDRATSRMRTYDPRPGFPDALHPVLSPDGATIAYLVGNLDDERPGTVIVRNLSTDSVTDRLEGTSLVSFSHDGRRLLYQRGGTAILRDRAARAEEVVARDSRTYCCARMSEDGSTIAMIRVVGDAVAVMIRGPGGSFRELTRREVGPSAHARLGGLALSPDGADVVIGEQEIFEESGSEGFVRRGAHRWYLIDAATGAQRELRALRGRAVGEPRLTARALVFGGLAVDLRSGRLHSITNNPPWYVVQSQALAVQFGLLSTLLAIAALARSSRMAGTGDGVRFWATVVVVGALAWAWGGLLQPFLHDSMLWTISPGRATIGFAIAAAAAWLPRARVRITMA